MKTINLIMPRGWHELDDKQLRYLFGLLSDDYSSAETHTLCLLRWSGLKILYRQDNDFVLSFGSEEFMLTITEVTDAIEAQMPLDEIPSFPVCPSQINQYTALPSDFLSVPSWVNL